MLIPLFGSILVPISIIFFIGNYAWFAYFYLTSLFFIGLIMFCSLPCIINLFDIYDEENEKPNIPLFFLTEKHNSQSELVGAINIISLILIFSVIFLLPSMDDKIKISNYYHKSLKNASYDDIIERKYKNYELSDNFYIQNIGIQTVDGIIYVLNDTEHIYGIYSKNYINNFNYRIHEIRNKGKTKKLFNEFLIKYPKAINVQLSFETLNKKLLKIDREKQTCIIYIICVSVIQFLIVLLFCVILYCKK